MKFNEPSVLERLRLQPGDLASARVFLDTGIKSPVQTFRGLTQPILEERGRVPSKDFTKPEVQPAGNPRSHSTASGQAKEHTPRPPVVWVPIIPPTRDSFEVLQRFDGIVLSICDDSFVARLTDKTHERAEEEAEIPLAEITSGDRELVKLGAMFYWVIGYHREAHGQISRSSFIRFRRLPAWSDADVKRAKKGAATFLSFLDLDKASNPA
jgi:hypothetical protein